MRPLPKLTQEITDFIYPPEEVAPRGVYEGTRDIGHFRHLLRMCGYPDTYIPGFGGTEAPIHAQQLALLALRRKLKRVDKSKITPDEIRYKIALLIDIYSRTDKEEAERLINKLVSETFEQVGNCV